jgi:hypothetical protein
MSKLKMMNPVIGAEVWAPLPGWGGNYEVELRSGRCRSVDRCSVNILGQRRLLRGVELAPCGRSRNVTLSHRGARRTFTPAGLRALAGAARVTHQKGTR